MNLSIRLLLVLGLAAPFAAAARRPSQELAPIALSGSPAYGAEIFFAVLEGLYADGVPDEVVDAFLLKNDAGGRALFVPGCPICLPTLNALLHYRARPDLEGYKVVTDTFGKGLGAELTAAATSADLDLRFQTLNHLVGTWMERRKTSLRLTPGEDRAWREAMELGRKQGMGGLGAQSVGGKDFSQKSCAACDAAVTKWK